MALAASLCSAEDCTEMALFARAKLEVLRHVVKPDHGPPSHGTFSRVFRMIAPEPFEAAFAAFMAAFGGALQGVVTIDGKALRGAHAREVGGRCRCIWSTSEQRKADWSSASCWHPAATRCWARNRRWRCSACRAASSRDCQEFRVRAGITGKKEP